MMRVRNPPPSKLPSSSSQLRNNPHGGRSSISSSSSSSSSLLLRYWQFLWWPLVAVGSVLLLWHYYSNLVGFTSLSMSLSSLSMTLLWPDPSLLSSLAINETIILTSVNCGYADMVSNWILHLERLGLTNYLVVARDEPIYQFLQHHFPGHVVRQTKTTLTQTKTTTTQTTTTTATDTSSGTAASEFGTPEFLEFVKFRPMVVQAVLNQNYKVLYSDVDMVFQKNPLTIIPSSEFDYVGFTDHVKLPQNFDDFSWMCTCLLYLTPTSNVTTMLQRWTTIMTENTRQKLEDQTHWNAMLKELRGQYSATMMDKKLFPNGYLYFNLSTQVLNPDEVYVVHANWMLGHDTKVNTLKNHSLWLTPPALEQPNLCQQQ